MSHVKVFFALMLLAGLGFAAAPNAHLQEDNLSCQKLIANHNPGKLHALAKTLYKQAFTANFDGDFNKAEAASQCASMIENGSFIWPIDAKTLLHGR